MHEYANSQEALGAGYAIPLFHIGDELRHFRTSSGDVTTRAKDSDDLRRFDLLINGTRLSCVIADEIKRIL